MRNTILFFILFFILYALNSIKGQNTISGPDTDSVYSDTIEATHYSIFITNINTTSKSIKGYTIACLVSHVATLTKIKLQLIALTVDSVCIGKRKVNYKHHEDELEIVLNQSLYKGDSIEATVYYHGSPFVDPSGWGGFHFSGDYAFNLGVGFNSVPHNLGKAWFACIDDFRDRAYYDVFITIPSNHKAISGGLLVEKKENINHTTTWHWKTYYTLPTYLISVTTGEYENITDTYRGVERIIPITLFCLPSDIAKVEGTFINLKKILRIYEDHFGPYPFERVGFTATAQGAMEHASNISYPYSGWNGSTYNEWWYGHELSHMWFGDKVTCASDKDMWLNEGFAVWCESLMKEGLYGKMAYKDNIRSKLKEVLQYTAVKDGGYFAVYGIPQKITYGSTVYQKGGQVVHTLRNYLGDSLFFGGLKAYLKRFAYQPASTSDFRDFLSGYTKTDLKPFFDTWVFSPGFPHFSVDSFLCKPAGTGFNVEVFVRQRLKELPKPADANRLEITFMDENWHQYIDTIVFSGFTGRKTFHVPFSPVAAMADLNEKIADATTDLAKIIQQKGETDFQQTLCKLNVSQVIDSAFVRITLNWIAPDTCNRKIPGIQLSNTHYWSIEGIIPKSLNAAVQFMYNNSSVFDQTLFSDENDSLILLYRIGAGSPWQIVPSMRTGNNYTGTITDKFIKSGEYTLGSKHSVSPKTFPGKEYKTNVLNININRKRHRCTIWFKSDREVIVAYTDISGNAFQSKKFIKGKHAICWKGNRSNLKEFTIKLTDTNGGLLDSKHVNFD